MGGGPDDLTLIGGTAQANQQGGNSAQTGSATQGSVQLIVSDMILG